MARRKFEPDTKTGAAVFAASIVLGVTSLLLAWSQISSRRTLKRALDSLLCTERTRIARDIHDELGSGLTQLRLIGEKARRDSLSMTETRRQIDKFAEKSEHLMLALDEIVWMIDPLKDNLSNLAVYLCQYARNFLEAASIRCRLDVPASLPSLPLSLHRRHHSFLAVKEALNNIAKHSGATKVTLQIAVDEPDLLITVTDNGCGFELRNARATDQGFAAHGQHSQGNGLRNMRERMREVDGFCSIRSTPGVGTTIEFKLENILESNGNISTRAAIVRGRTQKRELDEPRTETSWFPG